MPIIHLIHTSVEVTFRYHFSFMILMVELRIMADNEQTSAFRKYILVNLLTLYDYPLVVRWHLTICTQKSLSEHEQICTHKKCCRTFFSYSKKIPSHTWVFVPWQTVSSVQIIPQIVHNKNNDDFDHFVRLFVAFIPFQSFTAAGPFPPLAVEHCASSDPR